jgi:hypothetical protein
MKHLVVIAEKEELKLVEQLGFNHYPVLITGVGALNVIDALKDIPKDTNLINIGYAGSKDLEPGKFYTVNMVSLYHPNVDYSEHQYELGWIPWGVEAETEDDEPMIPVKCLTGTDFVLESNVNGCVFDMELAYIKALGFENVIAYKYVSDNLDLQEYREKLKDEN